MESSVQPEKQSWLGQHLQNDGFDPMIVLRAAWHRKWSILVLVLVVAMASALYAARIKPTYQASATLLIESQTANLVSIEQIYGMERAGSNYFNTQLEVLRSRSIAERVVQQLGLASAAPQPAEEQQKPMLSLANLRSMLSIQNLIPALAPAQLEEPQMSPEELQHDNAVRRLMGMTSITPVRGTQLVRIAVNNRSPREAALIANAIANAYIEDQMESKMSMSANATSWMNSRLDDLRTKLKESENRLQAFREQEKLIDINGVASISAAELSATSERMVSARTQRAEAESLYRQVRSIGHGNWERLASLPAILGDPLIQQFKGEQARARAKVDELSKRYGPRHPTMQAAQSELATATASLKAQVEQVAAGIERNYQLATANEGALRASVETNKAQLQSISRKEFQVRELQREVEANRALYETFMTRLKETSATEGMESATARIVEQAVAPRSPIAPRKSVIIAIPTVLAALLGLAIAALLEISDNSFKTAEQIESKLNLPVLGLLPLIKGKQRKEIAHLFSEQTDRSFAESIRTIRTSVMLSNMDEPHRVLVVTSSIPGEGKSTVAVNLAYALGQMERVLIIDADMRRPTLAKNFDFPVGAPGLANLIAGTARLEDCVKQVDGIDMLSAGTVPPNPLELLSSPRFHKVLEYMRGKYDRVVIDSPPTQAVSDALVLSSHANSVVYVIRSDSTAIPLVQKGVGQLLQSNAPLTGTILNQVDINKARKKGYTYDGYYDYYGYSNEEKA